MNLDRFPLGVSWLSILALETAGKRLELLRETVPKAP
jgi:hypothetical protein